MPDSAFDTPEPSPEIIVAIGVETLKRFGARFKSVRQRMCLAVRVRKRMADGVGESGKMTGEGRCF